MIGLDFEDNPTEDFEIETTRTLNSITISISSVTAYPQGLAENGELLIYPMANCSVLVRDRILNEQNKVHANLINDTLYFSKSVIFDPSQPQQSTEVYLLGEIVTQEAVKQGAFIPLVNVGEVIGSSYFPVE